LYERQFAEGLATSRHGLGPPETSPRRVASLRSVRGKLGRWGSSLASTCPESIRRLVRGSALRPACSGRTDEFEHRSGVAGSRSAKAARPRGPQQKVGAIGCGSRLTSTTHSRHACRCWTSLGSGQVRPLTFCQQYTDEDGGTTDILLTEPRSSRNGAHSNPIGYASWFFERMGVVLREAR